jgi:hypothetical protein
VSELILLLFLPRAVAPPFASHVACAANRTQVGEECAMAVSVENAEALARSPVVVT